jgi:phospholipid transport system substrate-binding protein
MTARFRVLSALALVVAVVAASPAWAGAPTDTLRTSIDKIFALLDDPASKGGKATGDRHKALRALAADALDYREAARRALGQHWDARTPDERKYFVQLFTDLIDHAYLGRLSHDGERVAFDDEVVTGKDAAVKARAIAKSGDVTPVLFTMHQGADNRWRVVDVSFEGMSLVGNYRAQFNKIIRAGSYADLVAKLEAKTRIDAQASTATTEAPTKNAP